MNNKHHVLEITENLLKGLSVETPLTDAEKRVQSGLVSLRDLISDGEGDIEKQALENIKDVVADTQQVEHLKRKAILLLAVITMRELAEAPRNVEETPVATFETSDDEK